MGKFGSIELLLLAIPIIAIYFIPTIIAFSRNHSNKGGIFLVNLLLGWTFIGWLASLIWSLSSTGKQTVIVNNYSNVNHNKTQPTPVANTTTSAKQEDYDSRLEQLQKLKHLFDSGILTEEEFTLEKSKVLSNH